MPSLEYFQFPYMSDNYGVLVHSSATGETACVDAGDADAVLNGAEAQGWPLTHLWITHHHADHTAGLMQIKQQTGCRVIGPHGQSNGSIQGLDDFVGDGDTFEFGGTTVHALQTPGHTLDMVNYHLPAEQVLFTGDTLFSMGCGRLFEGTAAQMLDSLNTLKALPPETGVYCSHEYTQHNGNFALSVDPDNPALQQRMQQVRQLRDQQQPTVPVTLEMELATNPFLRVADESIRQKLGMTGASDLDVFVELRERRNSF